MNRVMDLDIIVFCESDLPTQRSGSLSRNKQTYKTERLTSHKDNLSMKKPLVQFSGQSVLNFPESDRFPVVPSHLCRTRTNGQNVFRPRFVEPRFRCDGVFWFVYFRHVSVQHDHTGVISAPAWESQCLVGSPSSCRSYRPLLCRSLYRWDAMMTSHNLHTHNKTLIGCFLMHYFHR